MSTAFSPVPGDDVRRAPVVTAHPDDVDFGAAETVATWTSAGIEITFAAVQPDARAFPELPAEGRLAEEFQVVDTR